MLRHSVVAFLLVALCSARLYPRYEEVVRDPMTFDLLYSSTSGPHNETWHFTTAVNVSSFIIPSQVFNFWTSGMWSNGTYRESIELQIYETKLASSAANYQTSLVGSGSYSGIVNFGQVMHVPVKNVTTNGELSVQRYSNASSGYRYIVSIVFRTIGVYPWYRSRVLSSYSCVNTLSNVEGIAAGLAFTDA